MTLDVGVFLGRAYLLELGVVCQQVVEFGDERLHVWHKFEETFGNEYCSVVVALFRAANDAIDNHVDDVAQGPVLFGNFLADDADVRVCLERAFKGDV